MAAIKIFYAWQSDTSTTLNKNLIREAAEAAIKLLNADGIVEDAPSFELDHDTKGVPGSPIIAEEIFRKIDECDLFLADLSYVARYTKVDGGTVKWTPNANVLIEFGYARKTKGLHRMISVVNTASLSGQNQPTGKSTELPFDLAHLRHPIAYRVADARDPSSIVNVRDDLTKELVRAFSAALDTVIAAETSEKEADRKAQVAAGEARVRKLRGEFEQRLRDRTFRTFQSQGAEPVFGLGLIPIPAVDPPLDVIAQQDQILERLRPIASRASDSTFAPGSLWVFSPTPSATGETVHEAVTEINNDGSLFAASAVTIDHDRGAGKPAAIEFLGFEREVFRAIESYLRLLRSDLGVTQDLAFAMSLHGARNILLLPGHRMFNHQVKPVQNNDIICPVSIIPAGPAPAGFSDFARLLKASFNHLWQECGITHDPNVPQKQ